MKVRSINKSETFIEKALTTHSVWHKFSKWMIKSFGNDLYGEWQYLEVEKGKKLKYRNFNQFTLSQRIVGYDIICKIEKYVSRYCKEIKIINCDDDTHSGSIILLIPHPSHGITVFFIPQNTKVQNQFFLYESHCKNLIAELNKMKKVYKIK
jgi:hypothetical protein